MEPSPATAGSASQAQDLALFDALYQRHARALHAYFLGRTGEPARADDLTQETYVRVWKHLAQARAVPEGRRAYWLFAIARNLLVDHYRRVASHGEVAVSAAPGADGATYGLMPTAQSLDLDAAIAQLPAPWREALTMTYVGGLNSEEVGAALDLPAATVRYHLMLARQRLAELLALQPACATEEAR
jgi:RNA polymerase sigma-70 factor (ECF subfamily)